MNTHLKESIAVVVMILISWIMILVIDPVQLKFVQWKDLDIVALVSSLFVIAVVMERSIEALLIPVRRRDRNKLVKTVKNIKEEAKIVAEKLQLVSADKVSNSADASDVILQQKQDHLLSQKDTLRNDLLAADEALQSYRSKTGQYAMWISFFFGLMISVVGVRVLTGIVIIENDGFNMNQELLFNFVDVILTGGVIAGGSAAIDKMARKITSGLDSINSQKESAPE